MGVRGLTRYCAQQKEATSEVCEDLHDVTLAVDFVGFLYHVCELVFDEAQAKSAVSPRAWLLLGGCPDRLERYVTQWLNKLRTRHISLVFVTDPPQCFGGEDHRKGVCLADRAEKKTEQVKELGSMLFAHDAVTKQLRLNDDEQQVQTTTSVLKHVNGLFPFAREKLRAVLKKHGHRILTAKREADEELADYVRMQGGYAVLGHDSDFFCMRGIRYIPFAHLLVDDIAPLISARVFTPELVASSLGLRVDQLVDLAILCSNDLTSLLDQEYDMARKLHFPAQRLQMSALNTSVYFQPKQAANWIRQNQLSVLEDPTLTLIEAQKPGFLRALYEVYRFYGHSGLFLKRFPMTIDSILPKKKLKTYRKLLDNFDYPSSAVDVLETKSRGISNRFDPLMVFSNSGKTLTGMLAEVRQLTYHALNVLKVVEFDPGYKKSRLVDLQRHAFLSNLNSSSKAPRAFKQVDRFLRSLIFTLLYKDGKVGGNVASLCGSMGKPDQSGLAVKTAVYSLLLLWKYDCVYLQSFRLMNSRRMDLLLFTSLICIFSKPSAKRRDKQDQKLKNEQQLNWEMFTAAGCYVETLKQVYQLRILLGETTPPNSGCMTLFSSEVCAPICGLLDEESVSALSELQVKTLSQHFSFDLTMSAENFSEYFSRIRKLMNQMKALVQISIPSEVKRDNAQPQKMKNLDKESTISEQANKQSTQKKKTPSGLTEPPRPALQPPLPPPLPPLPPPSNSNTPCISPHGETGGTKKMSLSVNGLTPSAVVKRLGSKKKPKKPTKSQGGSIASNESIPSTPRESRLHTLAPTQTIDSSPPKRKLKDLMVTLPVFQHSDEILRNVEVNQLTIIQGETGCGKSTSVPQFIYDNSQRKCEPSKRPVNIYVTQPRRIAAIELANTVARMREGNEFGENGIVGSVIGYRIGQKQCISNKTRITYVTTGYMVERIIHDPAALSKITHLVLDEVHERSMDVDLLLLLLRLQTNSHPHLRIVIMSATMDAKVLLKYFSQALSTRLTNKKPLFVGSKLFPVRDVYLDECIEWFPKLAQKCRGPMTFMSGKYEKLISSHAAANSQMAVSSITQIHEKQLDVITEMICAFIENHRQQRHSQCILIFVPGINSINMLYESLNTLTRKYPGELVKIFVLHSGLELEHQQEAFVVPDQLCTKIILSTNIAESSVTIPDVTHVINCGIEKQIEMPNAKSTHAEVLMNTWCSRASAKQRAGRAGRVMAGTAFHLFPRKFLDGCMTEFSTPEMLRIPLDRTILQLKAKLHEFGKPSMLLSKALDAPDLEHIEGAYNVLAHFDAIDSSEEETAQITRFGSFVCHFPLDLQLCRLLMTGTNLRSSEEPSWVFLLDVVIVSAILAIPDLFIMPSFYHAHSSIEYMKEMKKNLKAKLCNDRGLWSEPLAIWRLYLELLRTRRSVKGSDLHGFLARHSIAFRRFQTLNFLISELCTRLISLGKNKSSGFEDMLNNKTVVMLMKLDEFASAKRADNALVKYAEQAVSEAHEQRLRVLRYLIVHNYEEHIITGQFAEPKKYKGDDLQKVDRVDVKVDLECQQSFFGLLDKQRVELFDQLASTPNPLDEFAAIAYEKGVVSLYSYAKNTWDDPASDNDSLALAETTSYDSVLPRMSFPASLLYYIRDQRFPVTFGLRDENGETDFVFRIDSSSGSSLGWSQKKDGVKVSIGGRSLFSLPVRPVQNKKEITLLAVYGERVFTGDETRMFCSKLTLLPPDSTGYYPLMMLVCARRHANIWIHVNMTTNEIVTIKVDGRNFVFPPGAALHLSSLQTINTMREAFSDALNGVPGGGKHVRIEDLCMVTDDATYVVKASRSVKGSFVWKQLRMEQPDKRALKAMRENGQMLPRFPELILV